MSEKLKLPVITKEVFNDYTGTGLIEYSGNQQYNWTQLAVDFACLLNSTIAERVETIEKQRELLENAKHWLRHAAGQPNHLYKDEYHAEADIIREHLKQEAEK